MAKDIIFETAKNMAIEQVLNMFCSEEYTHRPALKQLLEHLLNCYWVIGTKSLP